MITKKQLTDLTMTKLNGGPLMDYRKYHPGEIGRLIDVVLNSIIAQDIKNGDHVSSEWVHTLNKIPIKFDTIREQCFIEWSQEILLLENNQGIREIGWPVTETARGFNIMPSSSYQVYADLECSDSEASGEIAIVEGKRVYFPQMPKAYYIKKAKLTARVVLAAAAYDSDDILPVPEERFIEALSLIDQLTAGMKTTRMKVTNDSNPNTI